MSDATKRNVILLIIPEPPSTWDVYLYCLPKKTIWTLRERHLWLVEDLRQIAHNICSQVTLNLDEKKDLENRKATSSTAPPPRKKSNYFDEPVDTSWLKDVGHSLTKISHHLRSSYTVPYSVDRRDGLAFTFPDGKAFSRPGDPETDPTTTGFRDIGKQVQELENDPEAVSSWVTVSRLLNKLHSFCTATKYDSLTECQDIANDIMFELDEIWIVCTIFRSVVTPIVVDLCSEDATTVFDRRRNISDVTKTRIRETMKGDFVDSLSKRLAAQTPTPSDTSDNDDTSDSEQPKDGPAPKVFTGDPLSDSNRPGQ